jgi:hypothetical protein
VQDLAVRLVTELDVLEAHLGPGHDQRPRAGEILDLGVLSTSAKRRSMSASACLISR